MFDKQMMGALSVLLTVVSITPYIWNMFKGEVRPHLFSWLIWWVACAIIAAAQFVAGAGPGAWSAATSATLSLLVVLLALSQKSDWSITRSDWLAFIVALSIIPVWCLTHDALWASVLATLIDAFAYYPTFRKSWHKPYQEMAFLYFVANLKHIASIFAMSRYSLTALVMPVSMLGINMTLIAMLFWRRHVLAKEVTP